MNETQKELLEKYNRLLCEKNKVMNLTAHKTEETSWHLNVLDSLLFAEVFEGIGEAKLLDLGSGGGCPAVPLKICFPQLDITMVDSVGKKVAFLKQAVSELGLENIRAIHSRAEDFANTHRETFDIVTAKAVAELPTLLEYAMPFLKVGGVLFAFKGSNAHAEITASTNAIRELVGRVMETREAMLGDVKRILVVVKKIASISHKYPRGKNLPRLKPL